MTVLSHATPRDGSRSRRPRIEALDALRGFALCGILLTNIPQLAGMPKLRDGGSLDPVAQVLELTAEQRFFPVFSFLFGLSFMLFHDSAAARGARPRVVLLRRLVALALLGAGHQLLQPGEALLPYAVVGLLVLLPSTWLPRWLLAVAGAAVTVAGLTIASGGMALIPGLFLLGAATARYNLADTLHERTRQLAVTFALAAPAAVAGAVWQHATRTGSFGARSSAIAGLVMAVALVTGFLLLLRTPVGRRLEWFCAPLGRTALTNYVTATLLVLAASPLLRLEGSTQWALVPLLALVILTAQCAAGRWWLANHRYGPLEWAWRCVTWWQLVPLRRTLPAATGD